MADCSGGMVTTHIKTRLVGPGSKTHIFNMATGVEICVSSLTEEDIPGSLLSGRKLSELKNEELKFWLRCRGDPAKGLKSKAELVKR